MFKRMFKRLILLLLTLGFATPIFAGGPFVVNEDGTAATWDTSDSNPIELDPEAGVCGSFTNAQMVTLLTTNVEEWSNVSGVDLSFSVQTGVISVDATSSNYTTWYTVDSTSTGFLDGINPVFFDNDGAIIDAIFGSGSKFTTLGGAGADSFASGRIIGAEAVFNCRCLAGNSSCPGGIVFTTDDLNFTMTHEIGHAIGLDHTQINQAIADAAIAEDSSDTATACADGVTVDGVTRSCEDIPAMYPVAIDSATQIVPTRDDEVILLTLYGFSTWDSSLCTISGSLTDSSGNPLRCADVHAETDDPADTIAVVSGAFAPAVDDDGDGYTDASGECTSNCGDFSLRGLDPAKSYTITVYPLDPDWVDSASISPCGTAQLTGVVEQEIGTSSSCSAGGIVSLGALTTTSTGGVSSGGSSGGSSSSSTDEGLSCALHSSTNQSSWSSALILIFLFYGVIASLRLTSLRLGMTRQTRQTRQTR